MDEKGQTLYEGGGVVRADGNNFIPEIASAAIVLKALPSHLQADILLTPKRQLGQLKKNRFQRGVGSDRQVGRGRPLFGMQ